MSSFLSYCDALGYVIQSVLFNEKAFSGPLANSHII